MGNTDSDNQALDPSQLVIGLSVWLDMGWMEHPFLSNRFLIKTAQDIATIQSLPCKGRLYWVPAKSTANPLPLAPPPAPPVSPEELAAAEAAKRLAQAQQDLAAARVEKVRHIKDAAARAERAWADAASATREALTTLAHSPRMAGKQLAQLARETATAIAQGPDALLHLLDPKEDHGPQFHALNVMTLCMLLGKKARLTQNELTDLALAALAHDVGKCEIPQAILKNGKRKKHEEDHYRLHVKHSVQLAHESGAFGPKSIALIAEHHEAVDGQGWPKGLTTQSTSSRVLAMVNRYDRLCSPESPDAPTLMPSQALARMLRQESSRHDPHLLALLINLLGVYPPGTVVRLNDQSLALVVSPGPDIHRPRVLVYSPNLPEAQAPMLDLDREPWLEVVDAIHPNDLAPDVLRWLNPQKRLACFFSVENTPEI